MMMTSFKSTLLILIIAMLGCCRQTMASQVLAISSSTSEPVTDKHVSWTMTQYDQRTMVERKLRRMKNTKSKKSGQHKDKEDSKKEQEKKDSQKETDTTKTATHSSGDANTSIDTIKVKGTGMTMKLGGVNPLDPKARATWEDVTSTFILVDVLRSSKDAPQLKVSVHYYYQNPPYQGSRRHLQTSGILERTVSIKFDVGIEVESSKTTNLNANRFVAQAFNSSTKRTAYMRRLLATGDPAFSDVGSVSVDANLSSQDNATDAKEIGAVVGMAAVGLACIATALFVLFSVNRCHKNSSSEGADVHGKDVGSDCHAKTMTATSTSDDGSADAEVIPASVSADDASYYYDGNISVTWSMATDIPQTPQTANNKMSLLGAWSRESSESSIFVADDEEDESAHLEATQQEAEASRAVTQSTKTALYEV